MVGESTPRHRSVRSGDLVDVFVVGVRRWCGSDRLHQPRVRLSVVCDDLADDQAHPPFVAEVEQVGDPLSVLELEPTETDLGAPRRRLANEGAERAWLLGVERICVLAPVAGPELTVQPERIEVVGRLRRSVQQLA